MNNESQVLRDILLYVLGPGSGIAVKMAMNWLIRELQDEGKDPSPKTRRRMTYLVSILLPSAVYGVLVLLPLGVVYDVVAHILYVLSAFGVSQLIHGERNLPSGADIRNMQTFPPKEVV